MVPLADPGTLHFLPTTSLLHVVSAALGEMYCTRWSNWINRMGAC